MPSDMRDELVLLGRAALLDRGTSGGVGPDVRIAHEEAQAVIDAIPPGSFKNEKGEWVRLQLSPCNVHDYEHDSGACVFSSPFYTEVDHAE